MAALAPGTILGGRFALVGELGTGGTATVWLAVDQLRGERVALKVVHGHLANDPSVRRRLRREVAAASLLRHEAALVPWELHELDGLLALAMPYHPGQTLAERVASAGPLPVEKARALGVRVASALADAHRAGLLHRDVSANNVLLEDGERAVLTDFGLARAQSDATRSTGVLGTAGYTAPEVLSGGRADPRSDLYGLGCVLYLAVTGRTPYGTDAPLAVLQRQLAEDRPPVRSLRPDCPEDLASVIDALLRKDPSLRPHGATEVEQALRARVEFSRSPDGPGEWEAPARPAGADGVPRVHLPPGEWLVVVRERSDDRNRRRALRTVRRSPETKGYADTRKVIARHVGKRTVEMMDGFMAFVGVDPTGRDAPPGPEDLLVEAVAREGGVEASALDRPLAVYERSFVLARGIGRESAEGLAREARALGFRADAFTPDPPPGELAGLRASVVWGAMVAGWILTAMVGSIHASLVLPWIAFMVFYSMIAGSLAGGRRRRRRVEDLAELPVAFEADLSRALTRPIPGRYAVAARPGAQPDGEPPVREPSPPPVEAPATRGGSLRARADAQIDALERTIAALDLPVPAAYDLSQTARDLRGRASALADALDRVEAELAGSPEEGGWIEPRLHRLRTRQRAGEPVDADEIARLEQAVRAAEDAEAARARLESQATSVTASLLEIASTAARVRRELLGEDPSVSVAQVLERLKRDARAAEGARREMDAARTRRQRA